MGKGFGFSRPRPRDDQKGSFFVKCGLFLRGIEFVEMHGVDTITGSEGEMKTRIHFNRANLLYSYITGSAG